MIIIRLFLSIIALFFIGYPVIYYLLIIKSQPEEFRSFWQRAFIFFAGFYAGILLSSIYLMILSIASVEFSLPGVAIFSFIFLIFSTYLLVKQEKRIRRSGLSARHNSRLHNSRHIGSAEKKNISSTVLESKTGNPSGPGLFLNKKLLDSIFAFIVFLVVINFLVVVFFTFLFPIRFWDAISCWSLKGRAFFMDGGIFPFYTDHNYSFAHLSYPLYIPLVQTWIYTWLGVIDETLVKIIFPIFYLSVIFIFYYAFRQKFNRLFSIVLVFILSSLPVVMDHGYIEYTNLIFSVILFSGVYYFYIYIRSKLQKTNLLILAALFFTILTQVRTEGTFFLILFLIINTVLGAKEIFSINKRSSAGPGGKPKKFNAYLNVISSVISPIFFAFFLMLPWMFIRSRLGLSTFSSEWSSLILDIQNQNQGFLEFFNLPAALKAIGAGLLYSSFDSARAFLGSSYSVAWFVLAVILLINFKKSFKNYSWIFPIFISAGFLSLLLSFALIEEFIWSTDRYLLHLFPLTYFWIFYNLPLFKNMKN